MLRIVQYQPLVSFSEGLAGGLFPSPSSAGPAEKNQHPTFAYVVVRILYSVFLTSNGVSTSEISAMIIEF